MYYNPYKVVDLRGQWTVQCMTIIAPCRDVQAMLPYGLELGPQDLTPPGTHPVRIYFCNGLRAWMSWPNVMDMTYAEQTTGIPFVYRSGDLPRDAVAGPYYYMPRLWLDNWMPTSGGVLYWGYEKRLAQIVVGPDITATIPRTEYLVDDLYTGAPIIEGNWHTYGERTYARECENFATQLDIMDQRLISQVPGTLGPALALSNFDMQWHHATVQPIEIDITIYDEYVPGIPTGQFTSDGIDKGILGAYELTTPWNLSLPYSPDVIERAIDADRYRPY